MSDMQNATSGNETYQGGMTQQTAPVTAPPAQAPAAPPAAPSTPAPSSTDPFAELAADQHVFDRGYVERIRREGQRYRDERTQAADALSTYEQVFGGYDPQDRQVWLDLASTWANDPNRAAQVMQDIARAVLTTEEEPTQASTPPPASPTSPESGPSELSPLQVQQMIADAISNRDQQAAMEREVENIYTEVRAAGFDPSSREGFMVLWLANNGGGGDIQAGIKEMTAWKQSIVDDYVSGRANGHHPTPSPSNGAVATSQEPIHDLRGARKAAEAYIEAQMGAGSG